MLALQVGTTIFWIGVCVVAALAVLALILGLARAFGARFSRTTAARLVLGVGTAAVLVPVAGLVVYTQFLNDDAPPRFDDSDLADLVSGANGSSSSTEPLLAGFAASLGLASTATTEPASGPPAECAAATASSEPAPASSNAPQEGDDAGGTLDGEWRIAQGSEFGYRVAEILVGVDTEGVGRGSEIDGTFTATGSEVADACFVVQVESITSDKTNRDKAFNKNIMETDEFPTAMFVLTEPIELDELPEVNGDPVTAEATGDLTMHGVTQSVSFEVTVLVGEGADDRLVIGVRGEIPVTFADFEIDNPSTGPVEVGDEGTLEFLLAFERS